jgi:Fanconi-associated nuclease 1
MDLENDNVSLLDSNDYSPEEPLDVSGAGLESTLPSIKSDQEAIDEYEASKVAEVEETYQSDLEKRYEARNWVKGRSSIYVDAFNLALESVLVEESHLFDETERALFDHWRGLCFESQYL